MNKENNSDSQFNLGLEPTQYLLDRGVSFHSGRPREGSGFIKFDLDWHGPDALTNRALLSVIEADFRYNVFHACEIAGRVEETTPIPVEEGFALPLRFNEKFSFIEPYIKTSSESGIAWSHGNEWKQAKFEVVIPPHNFGIKYYLTRTPTSCLIAREPKVGIPDGYRAKYFERK